MLLVADGQEPIAVVPAVVVPIEVQNPPRNAPVEVRHVPKAAHVRGGTETNNRELPLEIGVFRPEGEELLDGRGTETALGELLQGVIRGNIVAEVNQFDTTLDLADAFHWEALFGDIPVRPVVAPLGDHLGKR